MPEYDTSARRKVAPYPNLDLSTNEWTFEERAETVRWYELSHGNGDTRFAQFASWMIDNNPAGFKRYRALVPALTGEVPRGIFLMHSYAVTANAQGCMYEMIVARQHGFSKRQLLDVLNYAFISGWPPGDQRDLRHRRRMARFVGRPTMPAASSSPKLVDRPARVPERDRPVRTARQRRRRQALHAWHERVYGEVPRFVDLWLKLRGPAYKANPAPGYEQATEPARCSPSNCLPLMTMNLGATRPIPKWCASR